jgi:hypothetical protein
MVAEAVMAADLVEDSTEAAAVSTAVASGDIAEAGVDRAGAVVGVGLVGAVAGAGDAAGDGVIPVGAGGLASALAGAGVRTGVGTRTGMAIPTILTPIIRIPHTMTRTPMRQRTGIGITVPTEIRVATRTSKIRAIRRRDRLASTTRARGLRSRATKRRETSTLQSTGQRTTSSVRFRGNKCET